MCGLVPIVGREYLGCDVGITIDCFARVCGWGAADWGRVALRERGRDGMGGMGLLVDGGDGEMLELVGCCGFSAIWGREFEDLEGWMMLLLGRWCIFLPLDSASRLGCLG